MDAYKIKGQVNLKGNITPQGAKNEALQVLAAVLLTDDTVIINNLPDILDVNRQIELLEYLGVTCNKLSANAWSFNAANVQTSHLESESYRNKAMAIRGSVMLLGPMLARFGKGLVPKPGGDKIGRRKIDTHLLGLMKLGAKFEYDSHTKSYKVIGENLIGADMLLEEASVTGTANIIMAAVLATGKTTIYNAACEPYIQQLCKMLNNMGAKIMGISTNFISIEGVNSLSGTEHTCLPDMIEIGSFIGLAAMTRSELTIKDCRPDALGIIPEVFKKLGIQMDVSANDIYIPAQEHFEIDTHIDGSILTLSDAPWPGFTPDLLSIALVCATQARGNVLIHQKMFESRLFFTDNLIDMGAQIILCDPHRATIMGIDWKYSLRGISMRSPDIRAGVALLIAALSAKGDSTIHNIQQIDRGYERIEERLNSLGAEIERIDISAS